MRAIEKTGDLCGVHSLYCYKMIWHLEANLRMNIDGVQLHGRDILGAGVVFVVGPLGMIPPFGKCRCSRSQFFLTSFSGSHGRVIKFSSLLPQVASCRVPDSPHHDHSA
jgi:hypothetical protein